jgi:excisionase family DNA binding protein
VTAEITPKMSAKQVAVMLGVSERHVLNHQRELGAFKMGRRVIFDLDKIKAFIDRGGTQRNGR